MHGSMESLKPLPAPEPRNKEKMLMPKGMITKGTWERRSFKKSVFKKEK